MTAQSLAWLEMYEAWKLGGGSAVLDLPARDAEAIWSIHGEWRKESDEH